MSKTLMFEAEPSPAGQIEQLEERIEELREAIRRSRRLATAGRACVVIGLVWIACLLLGLAPGGPTGLLAGSVLALGGLVLMGSSVGSTRQLELSLEQAERQRNAAIDGMALVAVRDGGR